MKGKLVYGKFSQLSGDIMGPFRWIPFMQCRHEIISMRHNVAGTLKINREQLHFGKGIGYIEKDRGASFQINMSGPSAAEGQEEDCT